MTPAQGCAAAFALSLIPACLILVAGILAFRGEIRLGRGELAGTRIWLVREPSHAGLAISAARIVEGSEQEGEACVATSVRFLLWRSEAGGLDTRFCECLVRSEAGWESAGSCPP